MEAKSVRNMYSIIAVTNKHTAKLHHVGFLYILTYDARKLKHKKNAVKGIPLQAEVALGVPDRLRPQIISIFGTTRVVGRQPLPQEKSLVLIFRG